MAFEKYSFSLLFIALFVAVALTGRVSSQGDRINIVFTENGNPKQIEGLRVEILSPSRNEVLYDLETSDDIVTVAPDLKSIEKFDVRLTFDRFRLILPNLNVKHFDNKWIIDIRNRVPKSERRSREMKKLGCDDLRVFRVDFNPKNTEGFWWLVTGCEQSR